MVGILGKILEMQLTCPPTCFSQVESESRVVRCFAASFLCMCILILCDCARLWPHIITLVNSHVSAVPACSYPNFKLCIPLKDTVAYNLVAGAEVAAHCGDECRGCGRIHGISSSFVCTAGYSAPQKLQDVEYAKDNFKYGKTIAFAVSLQGAYSV